jgi:general secretion pathway protein I
VRGFTLLEVLISLAILAGAVVTVIASFNYHLGIVARDKEETTAILLARAKLDDPGFAKLPPGKGNFAPQRPDLAWEKVLLPTPLPGVQRMVFTVSWNRAQRKLDLVRYVAQQ